MAHIIDMAATTSIEGSAVRLVGQSSDPAAVELSIEPRSFAPPVDGNVVIEIAAAGVNPSDVKAATGMMPYAIFPRTPGRDYAGTIVAGPDALLGKQVFGSSGDLGIRRDGTHATHLEVESEAVVLKPPTLTIEEAAGIGVPFVTAQEGLRRAGLAGHGETVLILGANGKVGQAAVQIATWHGARVICVVRRAEPYPGHASGPVDVIDASRVTVADAVLEMTDGRGADIVFNTVGEPFYAAGAGALAKLGRMILIASLRQPVPFDIFAFYRGRHSYVGIDTLALSSIDTGALLRELIPGFEGGFLKPFPIRAGAIYPLAQAQKAYAAVSSSARDRVILIPRG